MKEGITKIVNEISTKNNSQRSNTKYLSFVTYLL